MTVLKRLVVLIHLFPFLWCFHAVVIWHGVSEKFPVRYWTEGPEKFLAGMHHSGHQSVRSLKEGNGEVCFWQLQHLFVPFCSIDVVVQSYWYKAEIGLRKVKQSKSRRCCRWNFHQSQSWGWGSKIGQKDGQKQGSICAKVLNCAIQWFSACLLNNIWRMIIY